MLAEAIVFAACVKSVGCSEVAAAYATYYPETAQTLQKRGHQLERTLPPGVTAWGAFALRGEAIFSLESNYRLKFSRSQVFLLYDESF